MEYITFKDPIVISLLPNEPNSRYKTVQLKLNYVKKGIQLMNIENFCKMIKTSEELFIYYLSIKLNTKIQKNIIHGIHEKENINNIIELFLKEIIMCKECKLPEIKIIDQQKECMACGKISSIKTNNKIMNYIKKNSKTKEDNDLIFQEISIPPDEDIIWHSDTSKEATIDRYNKFFK